MPTSTTPKKGQRVERRKTGYVREIIGFTQKPDGVRRVRLSDGIRETRVRADQLFKTYRLLPA
jgi:hypothetical protein